jgi:hypothetical protein
MDNQNQNEDQKLNDQEKLNSAENGKSTGCKVRKRTITIEIEDCEHGIRSLEMTANSFSNLELFGIFKLYASEYKDGLKGERRRREEEPKGFNFGGNPRIKVMSGNIDDLPKEVFQALSQIVDDKRNRGRQNHN